MRRPRWIHLAALLALGACTEHKLVDAHPIAPEPPLLAQLELSDSLPQAGSELMVLVRLRGAKSAAIASFTERVSYDSAGLAYLGEVALTDSATRVSNPQPGLIRSAGIKTQGFGSGPLVGYRFRVVTPSAVASLHLTVDEMHEATHANAGSYLQVAPHPVAARP